MKDRPKAHEDMDEVYTIFKTYPKNSMMPAITAGPQHKEMVSMMIVANDDTIEMINKEKEFDVQITTYVENVHDGKEKNLVMRFDMYFHNAHAVYEGIITDEPRGRQKEFVEVLKNTDTIDLWITDEQREVKRVVPLKWEYEKAKNVLDKFLQ
ncbi:hypothetical protein [Fonticella tunisiensis]|uniref:Uncharacterized protein n=1 Tax=Fonticella tunisiensis TaxID=1096341 RepID=A0A4R7K9D1_9CLOT|nr:hypothetical protein [Fonticella tunisiensis]TDT50352.1 hypothetical protein EDD71_13012 [Fonticella tunisiensis]